MWGFGRCEDSENSDIAIGDGDAVDAMVGDSGNEDIAIGDGNSVGAMVGDSGNGGAGIDDGVSVCVNGALVGESESGGGAFSDADSVGDEQDGYESGSNLSSSDDVFTSGDTWCMTTDKNADDENNTIIIDSEDDYAVVPSSIQTRMQTLVYTMRRETTYICGQEVEVKKYAERDYYEKWD